MELVRTMEFLIAILTLFFREHTKIFCYHCIKSYELGIEFNGKYQQSNNLVSVFTVEVFKEKFPRNLID